MDRNRGRCMDVWFRNQPGEKPDLVQLRILCSGLPQDGDVRIGAFPEEEKFLVFLPGAFRISRQHIGASELKACQRRQGAIHRNAGVIQILLKLFCRFLALMQRQVGLATDIHGIERAADLELRKGRAEFVVPCCLEEFDGSRRISAIDLNGSLDGG